MKFPNFPCNCLIYFSFIRNIFLPTTITRKKDWATSVQPFTRNSGTKGSRYSFVYRPASARNFICVNDRFPMQTSIPLFTLLGGDFRDKNYSMSFLRSQTIFIPNFIQIGSAVLLWRGNRRTNGVTFDYSNNWSMDIIVRSKFEHKYNYIRPTVCQGRGKRLNEIPRIYLARGN